MKPIKSNVMGKAEYRKRMTEIVDDVAGIVSKTLGPCGHTALIQTSDNVIATKDGWHVTQAIHYRNIVDNSMKSMIESCGQVVVLRVGDGTTTVIKAASELNRELMSLEENYTIREIENTLRESVNDIIVELRRNAIPIDDSNLRDAIFNVAMVSTNWNEELSSMIADIYAKTKNPIIKMLDSGTPDTTYEIINGFDLTGELLLKNYYMTDLEHQTCELQNPTILVFSSKVMDKHLLPLQLIAGILDTQGQRLVVLAPEFDATFIQKLKTMNSLCASRHQNYVNLVPVKYVANFNIDRECLDDFTALCGAVPIAKDDDDMNEFFDDITTNMTARDIDTTNLEGEELAKAIATNEARKLAKESILTFLPQKLDEIGGTCDTITIGERNILIAGLTHKNEKLVEERYAALKAEIDGKIKESDVITVLTDDIRQKRIRLGKLSGSMGVIKVGGYGQANLKAVKDALDDATRACEAAFRDGYTVGSSIAIGNALHTIMKADDYNDTHSILRQAVDCAILNAFESVFEQLIINKEYRTNSENDPIVTIKSSQGNAIDYTVGSLYYICSDHKWGFDIMTNTFDKEVAKIINPVNVDIEVLLGCLRLVLNCVSSDQFVFTNYDLLEEIGFDEEEENDNVQVTMHTVHNTTERF